MSFDLPYSFSSEQLASHALFLSSRWINGATLSASSVRGELAANHVQTMEPDKVWRANGCDAEWLAWDFGADTYVTALMFVGHNLSPDATLRLRLAASAADVTAAPAVDSEAVSAWPTSGKPDDPEWPSFFSLVRVTNGLRYRYGRLDIEDPDNPDGFVQGSRLLVGRPFVPKYNVDFNPSLGLVSSDEAGRTPQGRSVGARRGDPGRTLGVVMSALEEDDLTDELFELQRYCALARDFGVVLFPAATQRFHKFGGQFRFAGLQPAQAREARADNGETLWQTTITLEEVM